MATPTNGQGGWTLDIAPMFRGGAQEPEAMLRAMLTYGLTPNFQLSISGPLLFSTTPLPAACGTAMMPTNNDIEALAGASPGAPGVYTAIATGLASRVNYSFHRDCPSLADSSGGLQPQARSGLIRSLADR